MSWIPVIALAALAFLVAAFVLRLPKQGFTLLGAALLFGLAGYALQGSPGQPDAPAKPDADAATSGELFVETRRGFYDPASLPSRFLITSDAFARRGDQQRAAAFAESAVRENPSDGEAWTALGIALSEHANGQLTPAALYAFGKAEQIPSSVAPSGFFLGLALLRSGQPDRAREIWTEILASAPADAPWRQDMAERIARLEAMMGAPPPPAI